MKRKILNLLFAVELLFCIEFLLILSGITVKLLFFYACVAILWLLLNFTPRIPLKRICITLFGIPILAAMICVIGYISWNFLSTDMQYVSVDDGKTDLYGSQSVMVIVPHQDDELNIAGGILEQYRNYGSEVHVVFVTNGDYYGMFEDRFAEAIKVCEYVGIDEDNVIFLGYGDQWSADGPHIYNAEPGRAVISFAGYSSTYGTASHPAYHEGNLYTSDNLLSDIKSVILEYRPDTILCSDYDSHIDHKATTLMFEKAMGEILKETPEYSPTVLKAYAYSTAWYAKYDYYDSLNILSTANVFESPYDQTPQIYKWSERLRLPVAAETLSRSLVHSDAYEALAFYHSQEAVNQGPSVVNGDRVYWERRTDSELYTADIETSSGEAGMLNDFMLIDSNDLQDIEHPPYDGTWIPSEVDLVRTINVDLDSPTDLYALVLYDNPSAEDNVLNAVITFDNGSVFETGALQPTGTGSEIVVDQKNVGSFTINLESTEGQCAGLTEIEGYAQAYRSPFSCIKLMDQNGHFIYDYITDRSGVDQLYLYTLGSALPELSPDRYSVTCDNERCSAEIVDGRLNLLCPVGEACTISISCNSDPGILDRVYIQNQTSLQRIMIQYAQMVEKLGYPGYMKKVVKGTALYKTFALASDFATLVLDHLN